MKKITFILLIGLFSALANAAIYRLGYPGIPVVGKDFAYNDFWNLQNAASNGDTVQVYLQYFPQGTSLDINKQLRIIGFGHTLDVNSGLQAINMSDSLKALDVTLQSGSAGSVVQGLRINNMNVQDSNITVSRCKFAPGSGGCSGLAFSGYVKNFTFENNFYMSQDTSGGGWYSNNCGINVQLSSPAQGMRFINNIIMGSMHFNGEVASGLIANNTYIWRKGTWATYYNQESSNLLRFNNYSSFLIKNNLFYYDTVRQVANGLMQYDKVIAASPLCIVQNNVSNLPAIHNYWGATNQWGVTNLFPASFNDGFFLSESALQLVAGSAALTAGKNNAGAATQCGIFGGEAGQVYKLSGIPAIPAIYQLTAPGINATTNPYNITTSTRSNN